MKLYRWFRFSGIKIKQRRKKITMNASKYKKFLKIVCVFNGFITCEHVMYGILHRNLMCASLFNIFSLLSLSLSLSFPFVFAFAQWSSQNKVYTWLRRNGQNTALCANWWDCGEEIHWVVVVSSVSCFSRFVRFYIQFGRLDKMHTQMATTTTTLAEHIHRCTHTHTHARPCQNNMSSYSFHPARRRSNVFDYMRRFVSFMWT